MADETMGAGESGSGTPRKIRERAHFGAGMGGSQWHTRVRTLEPDEEAPPGARTVPAETPEHDWEPAP